MNKLKTFALLMLVFGIFAGCTERVEPGYIGMVMKPSGLTGDILQPGNHTVWGRDKLVIMEAKELASTEKMNILCADDLNFAFDLKIRSMPKKSTPKEFLELMNRQGANIIWDGDIGLLSFDSIYITYVQPVARAISRQIVSKYQTTQIRENREKIDKAILIKLVDAVQNTPAEIVMAVTSNYDYPDVIEKAMTLKKEREVAIGQEKANQAIKLLEMENRLKLAQKEKAVRAAEAEAESVYFKVWGKTIGVDNYLKIREIERDTILYRNVGPGDKVIISNKTETPILPMINMK